VAVCSLALLAVVGLSACNQLGMLSARRAWKEANVFYRAQDYQRAAQKYEEVLEGDPEGLPEAYFFLANSYDNLYRPARAGEPENDQLLTRAVENYRLASEKIPDPKMQRLSLQYLVAVFGPDKLNDPSQAEPVLLEMIESYPDEPENYFVLGRLYEDSAIYDAAEEMFLKAAEVRPNDSSVYTQLAAYYNRQGEFDKTMEALHRRVELEPTNPEAHYIIANYYEDKVRRDFRLENDLKKDYITRGLEAVDQAIELKADYFEAITYRGLLLRQEALLETNRARQEALIKEADGLAERARELQARQVSGVGN
jgi:tetratricopeptide (TPR) repeat protein